MSALVASSLLALVLVEVAARFVAFAAGQEKLFEPDDVLGWRVIPNLSIERINADGEPWTIVTNPAGGRLWRHWRAAAPLRVLILGDSYAFGEGVDVHDRFDWLLGERHPDWSLINLGVMGYGTDQELIAARPYLDELRKGDVLLLLTATNDLLDLLRHTHSGRAKPWFDFGPDGALVEHPPKVTWFRDIRDQSYVAARVMEMLDTQFNRASPGSARYAARVYRTLVLQETAPLIERGVRVVIAHHNVEARKSTLSRALNRSLRPLCLHSGIECIDLDPDLRREGAVSSFLRDRHWSAQGHAVVASVLESALDSSASTVSRAAPESAK